MPGARSLWIVTMKFRPVKIEREAQDERRQQSSG